MQKATPHSTPCRSFSLDKESGTVNRETSGNDKESNLENDILLQTILPVVVKQKGTKKPVKTCAFYNNGSTGYFITEHLRAYCNKTYGYKDSIRDHARPEPCRQHHCQRSCSNWLEQQEFCLTFESLHKTRDSCRHWTDSYSTNHQLYWTPKGDFFWNPSLWSWVRNRASNQN